MANGWDSEAEEVRKSVGTRGAKTARRGASLNFGLGAKELLKIQLEGQAQIWRPKSGAAARTDQIRHRRQIFLEHTVK